MISAVVICGAVASIVGFYYLKSLTRSRQRPSKLDLGVEGPLHSLSYFDWRATKPTAHRPFLNQKHVSMGIQKCTYNDWIDIDNGYLDRLAERKGTVEAHPEEAIGVNEHSKPAIRELFTQVMGFLPIRFPTLFERTGSIFHNRVTDKSYNVDNALESYETMLSILSENVEEDFYIMCPDEDNVFRLQGYIAAFPGGFRSVDRIGQSVRQIHEPVPAYAERIGSGVDRFFQRMKGGEIIQRFNWSLQVDGADLFRLDGNNYYPEQGHELPDTPNKIDLQQCFLRVERQSLVCLHSSAAIVFCVRSYMTHLSDIKSEGNASKLADAIESMPEKLGNYKKRPFWEEEIYHYLRS